MRQGSKNGNLRGWMTVYFARVFPCLCLCWVNVRVLADSETAWLEAPPAVAKLNSPHLVHLKFGRAQDQRGDGVESLGWVV